MNANSSRIVVLVSATGSILTHFSTDRDEFPAIATQDRDRIFRLIFAGDLAGIQNMGLPAGIAIEGALYQEVDAWRISCATIDKPRPRKRRRKTATILPLKQAGGAHD